VGPGLAQLFVLFMLVDPAVGEIEMTQYIA
jgi:hypothetical protein